MVNCALNEGLTNSPRARSAYMSCSSGRYVEDNGSHRPIDWNSRRTQNRRSQGGYYGNALQAASARGHEKVLQILRKKISSNKKLKKFHLLMEYFYNILTIDHIRL